MERVSITDPNQIAVIVDVIHDCWFDVDDIRFDPETSRLTIRFTCEARDRIRVFRKNWLLKRVEVPIVECFLRFHHVKSHAIRDTEQVGVYDFNELEYDPNLKRIKITTGVPIDIEIAVERFEVSVEVTDKVIQVKTSTSIFG